MNDSKYGDYLPEGGVGALEIEPETDDEDDDRRNTVEFDRHTIVIDDFRPEAIDSRGVTYWFNVERGIVTSVMGGHYFESGGERITSQHDPMRLTWADVPDPIRERLAAELNADDWREVVDLDQPAVSGFDQEDDSEEQQQ